MNSSDLLRTYASTNVMDFQDEDWRALVSGLLKLAELTGEPSEPQQSYLAAMQAHLGEAEPDAEFDFSVNEGLPLEQQEIVLKVYMEYLFLEKEDDSFLNTYAEALDWFCVSPRRRRAILADIHKAAEADVSAVWEKYTLTHMAVNGHITVEEGETLRWENLYIRMEADIDCHGILEAANCVFVYKFDGLQNTHIRQFGSEAGLKFKNCLFRHDSGNDLLQTYLTADPRKSGLGMGSYDQMLGSGAFITPNPKGLSGQAPIQFDSCAFYGCSYFLSGKNADVEIKQSAVINPRVGFLKCSGESALNMEGCRIEYMNINRLSWQNFVSAFTMENKFAPGVLKDCTFTADSAFVSDYESDEPASVFEGDFSFDACAITNLIMDEQMVFASDVSKMDGCAFTACSDLKLSAKEIAGCTFEDCSLTLIQSKGEINAHNCGFSNCSYDAEDFDTGNGLIELGVLQAYKANEVSNCSFKGISVNNGYIITSYSYKKRRCLQAVLNRNTYDRCETNDEMQVLTLTE